jgi:predicted DNA-binding transcriptional regulator AlpA
MTTTSIAQVAKMLRPRDAAAWLGIATATLSKMRTRGTGPRFVRVGRIILYDPIELASWAGANTVSSTSEEPSVGRSRSSGQRRHRRGS